jgi:hypothetical protein
MRLPRSAVARFLLVLLLVLTAAVARSEETGKARIEHPTVTRNADGQMVIGYAVLDATNDKLVETLDSGLPVRFIYRTRLVRTSGLPFGGIVADLQFERVLEKDNLKNRYRVTEGDRGYDCATFDEALSRLCVVEGYPVYPVKDLRKNEDYRIELQVKLEEFRLPFHLHRILPFMNFWDVTTPWLYVSVPLETLRKP